MRSEAAARVDFSGIRYAQCWEDADVLLAALEPGPGKHCLSIASAGDNTLALLARAPERVLAIDLSPAQLACLELRVAAFRALQHPDLLALIGSVPCTDRRRLYNACRRYLSPGCQEFWDRHRTWIDSGIGSVGKLERYLTTFRTRILPLIHTRNSVRELLHPKPKDLRVAFYGRHWNTLRWRLLFRVFFSRPVMGALGRDHEFFRYAEGDVTEHILERARYALTELDPAENPYLRWIMTGTHNGVLPFALREENFEPIRRNLDALEWRCCALEDALEQEDCFDCFNLSDIFEYISSSSYEQLLRRLVARSRPGARLAYWNLLASRSRPASLTASLNPLTALSESLFHQDHAFFYKRFVVEQVL